MVWTNNCFGNLKLFVLAFVEKKINRQLYRTDSLLLQIPRAQWRWCSAEPDIFVGILSLYDNSQQIFLPVLSSNSLLCRCGCAGGVVAGSTAWGNSEPCQYKLACNPSRCFWKGISFTSAGVKKSKLAVRGSITGVKTKGRRKILSWVYVGQEKNTPWKIPHTVSHNPVTDVIDHMPVYLAIRLWICAVVCLISH